MHFPFCATKCHYCDFYSLPSEGHDLDAFVEAILTEAEQRAPLRPRTLFLGGGTPSLLTVAQLRTLLDDVHRITSFRDSAEEVSIECNPESLDREKATALLDLGVNRISIGFQSLEATTLELFGRIHDADQAFRAYDAARAAGFSSINIDVIYAARDHHPDRWRESLSRILDLEPDHLAAYNLAFERETTFSRWLREGRLTPSSEEVELELLSITRELASSRGLLPYEISNYASSGKECRHNQNYWRNGSYVGLGPSAVSHLDRERSGNVDDVADYLRRIASGETTLVWNERLSPRAKLGETWWLGLRTACGVDPAEARRTAAWEEPDDPALITARRLLELELLTRSDTDSYCLAPEAVPLADAVAAEFLVDEGSESASGASPPGTSE